MPMKAEGQEAKSSAKVADQPGEVDDDVVEVSAADTHAGEVISKTTTQDMKSFGDKISHLLESAFPINEKGEWFKQRKTAWRQLFSKPEHQDLVQQIGVNAVLSFPYLFAIAEKIHCAAQVGLNTATLKMLLSSTQSFSVPILNDVRLHFFFLFFYLVQIQNVVTHERFFNNLILWYLLS
jgi:hypothetical protein